MAFETTLWSRIDAAARGRPSAAEDVLTRYRPPLVAFFRHQGITAEDAEDLAQEVATRLVEKDLLQRADRARGRFRNFLLGVAKNVLREQRERANAQKRGGGQQPLSLDAVGEPATRGTSSQEAFASLWFEHLLQGGLDALASEDAEGYEVLQLKIEQLSNKEIGERVGRDTERVKTEVRRARKRLVALIKTHIAEYSSSSEEYEEDLAAFMDMVRMRGSA